MQLLEDVLLQVIFLQASIVFASWLAYAQVFRRTPLVGTLFSLANLLYGIGELIAELQNTADHVVLTGSSTAAL